MEVQDCIRTSDHTYILDGKYTRLTGWYAVPDGEESSRLWITGDSTVLKVFSHSSGDKPIYVDVDITGVDMLTIDTGYVQRTRWSGDRNAPNYEQLQMIFIFLEINRIKNDTEDTGCK